MKPRFALGVATGLALALAAPTSSFAQGDEVETAKAHYKAAMEAEKAGNYAGAALEYGIAYDIMKDPILFFKIGVANEKAGKCNIALTYFARYMKEGNPSDEYKRVTEEKVAGCKATLGISDGGGKPTGGGGTGDTGAGGGDTGAGGGDTGAGGGDTGAGGGDTAGGGGAGGDLGGGGPAFTDGGGATWKRSAAWISTGATIGLLAVGTVLYMSGEGSEEDIDALIDFRDQQGRPVPFEEVQDQYNDLVDEGERFDKLATYAFIGAGVGAAAAVTLFVLDAKAGGHEKPVGFVAKRRTPHVAPRLGPETAGVVLGWEF
ncbi:MAG TPA: hypothetical protein VM261_10470 [Kofleriaceae bacterium]|nr:hypothetical protein [Kofleriaceae bacterium]